MDWIFLAYDRNQWWSIFSVIRTLRFYKSGEYLVGVQSLASHKGLLQEVSV
jgi:hypothetical protein